MCMPVKTITKYKANKENKKLTPLDKTLENG
jgi:hypothetical protein